MNKTLLKKFNDLEHQTGKFLNIISEHSVEQQRFRPSEYEWAMIDVVEHLATSEKGINKFFQKYKPENTTRKMKLKNHVASALMQTALYFPTKFPAPAALKPPQGDTTLEEWKVYWTNERSVFKEMLERFPKEKMPYSVFKHPRSGPMDMKNVIDFMKNHVIHHIYQLNRIKKSKGFPV
jgi:uncharacterized damage-inducible protein DinB